MRKANKISAIILTMLFIAHMTLASLFYLGVLSNPVSIVSRIFFMLMCLHVVFGITLTARSVKAGVSSGKWYFRKNAVFWIKRFTGILIVVLGLMHFAPFAQIKNYTVRLVCELVFYLCAYTHTALSFRAVLIKCGFRKSDRLSKILATVLALLIASAIAALLYFLMNL